MAARGRGERRGGGDARLRARGAARGARGARCRRCQRWWRRPRCLYHARAAATLAAAAFRRGAWCGRGARGRGRRGGVRGAARRVLGRCAHRWRQAPFPLLMPSPSPLPSRSSAPSQPHILPPSPPPTLTLHPSSHPILTPYPIPPSSLTPHPIPPCGSHDSVITNPVLGWSAMMDYVMQRLADGARVRRRSSRRARGARLDSKRAGGGYLYERAGQVVSLRSKG